MKVERRDNGDVVLSDLQGRPMLKLQVEGPHLATSSTGQMFALSWSSREDMTDGIMEENRQLKRKLAGDTSSDEQKSAARQLWQAATDLWHQDCFDEEDNPVKDLYKIGVALGFIEEVERD